MKLAGVVLGVLVLAVGAAPAMAESDPGWFERHSSEERQALVDYAYVRTAQATVPYSGEAATLGQALADDVAAAGAEELPLAAELGAEEFATLESAGLMAEVSALAPALALGAGILVAGVAIDVGVHTLFVKLAAPDDADEGGSGAFSWNTLVWKPYGYELYSGGRVQQSPGAYVYRSSSTWVLWDERPCPYTGFTAPAGASLQTGVATSATCWVWANERWTQYPDVIDYPYVPPAEVRAVAPLRPYDAETDHPDYYRTAPTAPGATAVERGLATLDAEGNELLRGEADWALTPGAQPEEEPVRPGVDLTENDRACKSYFGESGQGDPGRRSPDADPLAPDWDYDVDEFEGVYNPLTRSTQTVQLRWGDSIDGWGYRHIKYWHGWNAAARLRTALALADPAPTVDRLPTSFRYVVNLANGPAGVLCQQRVIVSYREDNKVPVGRHIITSFVDGVG
ncbi:MAG TPA: hypothetical protein VF250_01825 [Conexibacter sp.]